MSVMDWGAITYKSTLNIVETEGTMDSEYYINDLQNYLIPNGEAVLEANWIFQYENTAVHTSNITKTFLEENDNDVLDWHAK